MAVFEMCHAIPPPLRPRCFAVLVVTASLLQSSKKQGRESPIKTAGGDKSTADADTQESADARAEINANDKGEGEGEEGEEKESDRFIAITIPVDLRSSPIPIPTSMYSTGRNVREGKTSQQRKRVVMGIYAAVETVRRKTSKAELGSNGTASRDPRATESPGTAADAEAAAEIEWIMATASDAKGVLPMWIQKTSVPSAVAKDVGYFLKWIRGVDDAEIKKRREM
jgi:hypothetical protein